MNIINQLRDLAVWAGEVMDTPPALPATALSVIDGKPFRMRLVGSEYVADGGATSSDSGPLFLTSDQVLAGSFRVSAEAMLYGSDPARLELSRRCPFPLEDAAWGLRREPEAWTDGAPWAFAALPLSRLAALRKSLTDIGARPGYTFTMTGGLRVDMTGVPRKPNLPLVASMILALVAALIATLSITLAAGRVEQVAEDRLAAARQSLDRAESAANSAGLARETAEGPIRTALAANAALHLGKPAGATLAALTAATDDDAHVRRLRITPSLIEGEFIAPDAAALAAKLGAMPPFSAARLKTAARTDATTGLQAATLEITLEAGK